MPFSRNPKLRPRESTLGIRFTSLFEKDLASSVPHGHCSLGNAESFTLFYQYSDTIKIHLRVNCEVVFRMVWTKECLVKFISHCSFLAKRAVWLFQLSQHLLLSVHSPWTNPFLLCVMETPSTVYILKGVFYSNDSQPECGTGKYNLQCYVL